MAGFFSKASSFLSSQANQQAPSHAGKGDSDEETRKSSSPGGYSDLLAGAQALMDSGKPSDEGGDSVDKEEIPHKTPSSGGYGDLLASAQSLMAKANAGSKSDDKEGEIDKPPSSGGYGDLLASAQAMMGSAKLSSGGSGEAPRPVDKEEAVIKKTSSGDASYGDVYASAQVLMGAAKASREGAAADMGEVAGATANLIGAATQYGNLEKTAYGEYANKAQTYLHDYQASHGKAAPHGGLPQPSSGTHGEESNTPGSKPVKSDVNFEEKEEAGFPKNPVRSSEEEYN